MSTGLGKKIRKIREAETSGRAEFCRITGIKKQTLINIERGDVQPNATTLLKITEKFPQYAFWLVTDQVQVEAGHYKPRTK